MVGKPLITSLLQWYRDGEDVMTRLPLLSTYLGHASVTDTQVYLTITAALLQEASTRFHDFTQDLLPPPGGQP
jgi:integrase/recombinase XerD